MLERKIILDPGITADAFEQGALEAGWEMAEEIPQSDSAAYEQIWLAADSDSTIHYVEDPFVKVRYALARGDDADALAARVRELFRHVDEARMLEVAEKNRDDLQMMIDWLMAATVLGDQAGHERLRTLVEERLGHSNSGIRRAALISVGWLDWPEFRETVERMAKDDPAGDVREDAASLVESYRLRDAGKL